MIVQFIILLVTTGLAGMMTLQLTRAFRRFRIKQQYIPDGEAPSVSVCIAARNENHVLAECLQRVLASDYPKLEVIVYDDTSEDDTSMIVKSFAHAGVRFVEGTDLPAGWLGRNYAFDTLAREASGTFVVMMTVDAYIKPNTISQLVGYMMSEKMEMISVIPGRSTIWRSSVIFGHLYHYWQLMLSRPHHPAASETLWMMRRHTLIDTMNGFSKLKASILMALRVAQILGTNSYHCLINNDALGVTFEKKLSSQVSLSVRSLYPLAGETLWGGLLSLFSLMLLAWTPFGAILALITHSYDVAIVYILLTIWLMTLYGVYAQRIWNRWSWLAGLVWPVVIIQEVVLMSMSMYRHLTKTVTWKGRLLTVK